MVVRSSRTETPVYLGFLALSIIEQDSDPRREIEEIRMGRR